MVSDSKKPAFRPFIEACREHGIPKSTAYVLLRDGLLETFTIGRSRYIYLDSLHTLPERLAKAGRE